MKVDIVIGLGYGDEGKGNITNGLADIGTLVVRFNGGHQAGHTVHANGVSHVFSSFGSGTLKGCSTYISRNCTVDPFALEAEEIKLNSHGIKPKNYFDAEVMVSTPWDSQWNKSSKFLHNGTVGVGFGATVERNENFYKLYVRDLQHEMVFWAKIEMIRKYYENKLGREETSLIEQQWWPAWMASCERMIKNHTVVDSIYDIPYDERKHIVCEGAQGVLLDMDYGFFPHVTRSNTTSKNAFPILAGLPVEHVTTWYVTRAYQTRHGHGPITGDELNCGHILPNEYETNTDHGMQGKFVKATLDMDSLKYAVKCDQYHNRGNKFNLVVTCMDHSLVNDKVVVFGDLGDILYKSPGELAAELGLGDAFESHSPELKFH